MKIIYVKNNNNRAKEYQIGTIIYEKNATLYVEKRALCMEAIPHLMKMITSHHKLSESIVSSNFKLAKILKNDEMSITFEYIDGISLEQEFNYLSKDEQIVFIELFMKKIESNFKIKIVEKPENNSDIIYYFNVSSDEFLKGEKVFDGVSNIDFIFSNLIKKNDIYYIIDYEWVFDFDLPIEYIKYRLYAYYQLPINMKSIYKEIEEYFFSHKVTNKQAFYQYSSRYKLKNLGKI
ncbi:MAG: hypothetical protein M0R46_15420 [Candidatus Muirbacterium halophilum]|nr:hypothetical protein [Candidatus Muirbacterium halophilum]MCK9477305.1 hypothetical protein [Candidatus Muirbacterium halophilum]